MLHGLLSDAELGAAREHADDLLRGADWSANKFAGRRVYSLLSRAGSLVIWALDDFTADNGRPDRPRQPPLGRRPKSSELIPAGSALVYSGRLRHAAGHNAAENLPWLRPADNHI